MATSKDQLQEELSWDINRLNVDPGVHGSDDALAVLDETGDGQVAVENVRAYAGAHGDQERIATKDLLRVLQLAEGRLALVTWSSAGITAIGYLPNKQRFDVGQFSGIDKRMGKEPESYQEVRRSDAKELLAWSKPTVVHRSESNLLPELADVEVTA